MPSIFPGDFCSSCFRFQLFSIGSGSGRGSADSLRNKGSSTGITCLLQCVHAYACHVVFSINVLASLLFYSADVFGPPDSSGLDLGLDVSGKDLILALISLARCCSRFLLLCHCVFLFMYQFVILAFGFSFGDEFNFLLMIACLVVTLSCVCFLLVLLKTLAAVLHILTISSCSFLFPFHKFCHVCISVLSEAGCSRCNAWTLLNLGNSECKYQNSNPSHKWKI